MLLQSKIDELSGDKYTQQREAYSNVLELIDYVKVCEKQDVARTRLQSAMDDLRGLLE